MKSRRGIRFLSFIMMMSLCWMPVRWADASSASSVQDSPFGLPSDDGSLIWNTFLGTAGYEDGYDIAIDSGENLYIAGDSDSNWGSPLNTHSAGTNYDALVVKMDSNGGVLWNTFLGSSGNDFGLGIALDASGNIYVTGLSASNWGAPVRAFTPGIQNVFVAKLNSSGTLLWNTFFPYRADQPDLFGLAVDTAGNVVLSASSAISWGSPIRPYVAGGDAFVARLNSSGELIWNTFLGGTGSDDSWGLALDSAGNAYVSGVSGASWGSPVRAYTAGVDTFVARLDSNGVLSWHTFLGGSGTDYGFGFVVDGSGNIYSAGYSTATWGSPLAAFSTSNATSVARLNSSGGLVWNTFALGNGHGLTADGEGSIYVSGCICGTAASANNGFAAKLQSDGAPVWSTILGTSGWTFGVSLAVGPSRSVYVVGFSEATWGTPLNAYAGTNDAFVAKLQGSAPLYVKANATGSNDGTSWTNAYISLQSALAAAGSGDEIWVAAGIYLPTTDTDRAISFSLKDGVEVYGGFTGAAGTEGDFLQRHPTANVTILSGDIGVPSDASDNSYHVVVGSGVSSSTVLDGFTIQGGNASATPPDANESGGGMYNDSGSPALANITFSGNAAAGSGGGMTNINGSSPVLSDVHFDNNTATDGGGMYNKGSSPTLSSVTFSNNEAVQGGGMHSIEGSNAVLTDVAFIGNTATDGGGGMFNYGSNPTLTDVTFSGNTSTYTGSIYGGGGMCNDNGSPALTDVTFSGNSSATGGGGMLNDRSSSPVLTNVTFSDNTAGSDGGGLADHGDPPSSTHLTNVAFSGNAAAIIGGGLAGDASNPVLTNVTFSDNSAQAGGGIYVWNGSPQLTNVTFSNNTATGTNSYDGGGGLYNDGAAGVPTLTNATFSGNAAAYGSAIRNHDGSPTISNSIFWGDGISEIDNYETGAATIQDSIVAGGCPSGSICTHVLNADPKLGPLQDNGGFTQTRALLVGSAALDAGGVHVACAATDQRGVTRPQGPACDMGAFEAIFLPPRPGIPALAWPPNGYVGNDAGLTFEWNTSANGDTYEIQIDNVATFAHPEQQLHGASGVLAYPANPPLPGGTWFWRVRAYNTVGAAGGWSGYRRFVIDTVPPAPPALYSPASGAVFHKTPTFAWLASATATAYRFQYSTAMDCSAPLHTSPVLAGRSYTPPAMTPGTYYWCARARDRAGNWSALSPSRAVVIQPRIPAAPTLLVPVAGYVTNNPSLPFAWNAASGGDTYEILIDNVSAFSHPERQFRGASGVLAYTASPPLADGKYYWRVRAYNVVGKPGPWSASRALRIDTAPPAAPALSLPAAGAIVRKTPTFSWLAASTATAYQFQYSTSADCGGSPYTSSVLSVRTHTPPAMGVGTFYWAVRARDVAGNWSALGECRQLIILPPIPRAPTLAYPSAGYVTSNGGLTFRWNLATAGDRYEIQIDSVNTFVHPERQSEGASGVLYYTASPALPPGLYYWRVRSYNVNGEPGPWSGVRSFKILPTP